MFSLWDSPKTLSENAALKLKTKLSFFTESILICHFRKSTYVIIKLKKRAEFHYGSHRPCQSRSNDNSWYSGHVYVMQPFVISYLCLFYYKMFAVKRVSSSLLNDCCFFAWLPMWGNKGCKNYIMSSDFYILLSFLLIKVTYCTHLLTGLQH